MAKITTVTLDPKTLEFSVDNTGYQGNGCGKIVAEFAKGNVLKKDIHKPEYRLANQNGATVCK